MDYEKNKKYFKPINWKIPGIVIAVGLLLLGASPVVGLIVVAVGGVLIYLQIGGRPSDSQIDQICKNEIADVKQKALSKLGIDEDEVKLIEPILINGPYYRNIVSQVLTRQGSDGRRRSSNFEAIVLFFSESQIHSYSYRFSLVANEKNETTDEYFYKDVVSVATSSNSLAVKDFAGKDATVNFEEFKLTTSGGTSITCSMWDAGMVEKSIQGMRQLLKQRKMA